MQLENGTQNRLDIAHGLLGRLRAIANRDAAHHTRRIERRLVPCCRVDNLPILLQESAVSGTERLLNLRFAGIAIVEAVQRVCISKQRGFLTCATKAIDIGLALFNRYPVGGGAVKDADRATDDRSWPPVAEGCAFIKRQKTSPQIVSGS